MSTGQPYYATDVLIPPNVTPLQGAALIANGGVAILSIQPGAYGGYIWNPLSAADQGLMNAESLFVDPFAAAGLAGYGSTVRLAPGDYWMIPLAKSTSGVWANAASDGHRFTAVYWVGP